MIPSIKFFGLNEFSARLPSAIFGSLAILSSFYLVLVLVKSPQVALITAFLLATSPWAIQFSRMALEANLAVFFITSGLLFLLVSFERPFALYVSSVFFSVSLYSYHAAKLFVPLFLLCLFFVFHEKLKKNIKVLIGSLFLAIFLVSPLVFNLTENSLRPKNFILCKHI